MNKLSKTNVLDTVSTVGSVGLGVAVSKGVDAIAPESMKTPLVKGGIALATVIAAALIPSKSGIAKMGKNATIGFAIEKGWSAIADVIRPTLPTESATASQKFIGAAFGLNGSEDGTQTVISRQVWDQNKVAQPQFKMAAF